MPHTLILGMTETGKSTLARALASSYRASGIGVGVLDPMRSNWDADFQTDNLDEFKHVYNNNRSMALFIDEAGMQGKFNDLMIVTATTGRHKGHNMHYVAQCLTMLHPHLRGQCRYLAVFQTDKPDADNLWKAYPFDELRNAWQLKQGEYYWLSRFGGLQKRRIF